MLVNVSVGVMEITMAGVLEGTNVDVIVAVEMFGVAVALATPMMTGVAVNMDGVDVEGRNGVGWLPGSGWITQPLHEDSKNANRIAGINFFIFSPLEFILSLLPR